MRLLVTRPRPDADETAEHLRALGHDVIVAPLTVIDFAPEPEIGFRPAALLFTSRNGETEPLNGLDVANAQVNYTVPGPFTMSQQAQNDFYEHAKEAALDYAAAVKALKQAPGKGIFVGGVTMPLALAELGLIDEYELVVHPRVAGHGPTLFAGLSRILDLELVDEEPLGAGIVARRFVPRR